MTTEGNSAAPVPTSRLRTFHPGWFGAVMGTSILGVAAYMNPGGLSAFGPAATVLGVGLTILAYLLAIMLGIPYLWRWLGYPQAAMQDLRNPVAGPLYATFPGGILVLAAATTRVGPGILPPDVQLGLTTVLAVTGVVLSFLVSIACGYTLFVSQGVAAEQVTGGWFIPAVVNIFAPVVFMPLLPSVDAETARLLVVISAAGWGIGFFLFLLVAATFYSRLVLQPLPAAALAPSLWINLGPVSAGSLSLLALAQGGPKAWGDLSSGVSALASVGALALWGLGVWWFVMLCALLLRYRRAGGLPYTVGWWAFTFPLGALTVDTLTLAQIWRLGALEAFGALLFLLLVAFWLTVATRTLLAVRTGEAWRR
jgi:C4-dicarboxylate transporter/malic acid transport protein